MIVFASFAILYTAFTSRYEIGFSVQEAHCLHASLFLIDKWDTDVEKGDIVLFESAKKTGPFQVGDRILKLFVAGAGDNVQIEETYVVINGEETRYVDMQPNLAVLNMTMDQFDTNIDIPSGQMFMLGETPESFDSRFWGTIDESQVIGTAYAIF